MVEFQVQFQNLLKSGCLVECGFFIDAQQWHVTMNEKNVICREIDWKSINFIVNVWKHFLVCEMMWQFFDILLLTHALSRTIYELIWDEIGLLAWSYSVILISKIKLIQWIEAIFVRTPGIFIEIKMELRSQLSSVNHTCTHEQWMGVHDEGWKWDWLECEKNDKSSKSQYR